MKDIPSPLQGRGLGRGGVLCRDRDLLERAKAMRREPTPFETKLWHELRGKRFTGAKFRHQVVIGRYIVDFSCRIPTMLIVEVDGDTHGQQGAYDSVRTSFLERRGYLVLRFTNVEVESNFEGVLMAIKEALQKPSPLQGRGRGAAEGAGESTGAILARLPLSPALSPEGERE